MENIETQSGFTLLELMITLFIAGIIATIAIPSFRALINGSRLTAYSNDFVSALNYARTEAIYRNSDIVVMKLGSAPNDKVWDGGWQIWDLNAVPDELLKQHEGTIRNGFTLRSTSSFQNSITYNSDGISETTTGALGLGRFVVCDATATLGTSREIIINNVGRVRTEVGNATTCTPP